MHRSSFIASLVLCAAVTAPAMAVPPSNGYIGVFGDAQGTDCVFSLNRSGNGRMYVYATTGGATSAGIQGAEFRIQIDPPAPGALIIWQPSPDANVTSGNVIDNGNGGGGFIFFNSCQTQTGLAGDKVKLGEIQAWGLTGEHRLIVRRSDNTTNGNFACPSVLLCDEPAFTQVCLTLENGDPALGGEDPMGFVSVINSQSGSGGTCGFVATETETWSTVKDLYR